MKLDDTLSGEKKEFAPWDGRTVRMYVCGVTPYDTTHIGHAMTYLTFDVVNRYCQYLGWRVKYVQNVTDIDDDILRYLTLKMDAAMIEHHEKVKAQGIADRREAAAAAAKAAAASDDDEDSDDDDDEDED